MDISFDITGLKELISDTRRVQQALKDTKIIGQLSADARTMNVQNVLNSNDADGGSFPDYSTKPLYMARTHRPRPHGGRRQSVTGKRLKSVFYEGGYAQFRRETVGNDRVDLHATMNMMRAFQAKQLTGFKGIVHFIKNAEAKKAAALQKKYNFIGLPQRDHDVLRDRFAKIIDRTMRQYGL